MAFRLLNGEISELCIGKLELVCISASSSISDALAALKASGDTHVSVWVCGADCATASCVCVGKFSVADAILFLCRDENLADPFKAFQAPVYHVLPKAAVPIVRHLESNCSLFEAIDYILEGTQNLVIPITNHQTTYTRKQFINTQQLLDCNHHISHPYCWLTGEDVLRYLFSSIQSFSPIPNSTIKSLNVIHRDILILPRNKLVSSALGHLSHARAKLKPIAVVDDENRLIGEISPYALSNCDKSTTAAIMALSAEDLMAYLEYNDPPRSLVQMLKMELEERNLVGMLDLMDEFFHTSTSSSSSCCSSDDESLSSGSGQLSGIGGWGRYGPESRSEAVIVCSPGSSLAAVMLQALSYRVPTVWVVDEDRTLVGAVTLAGMLEFLCNVAGLLQDLLR